MLLRTWMLVALAGCSIAYASEPGQPLDCTDMVFDQPGYSCSTANPQLANRKGPNSVIDNSGRLITATDGASWGAESLWIYVVDPISGNQVELARIMSRPGPNGTYDGILTSKSCSSGPLGNFSCGNYVSYESDVLWFDPVAGALFIPTMAHCSPSPCTYGAGGGGAVLRIDGFARLFDIFQSYQPQAGPLSFRVPAMPDGLAGADHFDTYWGDLATVGEWSKAKGLQCSYPSTAPSVGDYFEVPDTIATPAPGQGVYYVTAATYQGVTRYGRKTSAGHLSGRDPALLPACIDAKTGSRVSAPQSKADADAANAHAYSSN
jgi:hypothetical protein